MFYFFIFFSARAGLTSTSFRVERQKEENRRFVLCDIQQRRGELSLECDKMPSRCSQEAE